MTSDTTKISSVPPPGPNEAPPSYNHATTAHPGHRDQDSSHLSVSQKEDDDLSTDDDEQHLSNATGVAEKTRRSMETELMELPKGWVREFDASSQHVYYVDTTKNPTRSIWVHPYEPEYLSSIPDTERTRLFGAADPQHEQGSHSAHASTSTGSSSGQQPPEKRSLGRKLKDKMTNSTHEERQAERRRHAEEEMKRHQAYIRRRKAMLEASQNGTYAPMYAAPNTVFVSGGGYGGPYGGGYGGYGGYGRPMYGGGYGYGYGGPYGRRGMGGAGMGAGLLGGVLLGGLLF